MQIKVARRATLLLAGITAAVLTVPNVSGQACSNRSFDGTYAFQASGVNLAAGGAAVNFAGSIEADGMGKIVAWKDWVALPASDATPPQFKQVPPLRDIYELSGQDIQYQVEEDCRIQISAVVASPLGMVPVKLVGALASGGREALLINGSEGSPFLTTITMKRSDDARIDAIQGALRRIGERFGLLLDFKALEGSAAP